MAQTELSKALRDLPNRMLNVPINERPQLIQDVIGVLGNPGITPKMVKGFCKVIGTTLTKYKDKVSQLLVRNLIAAVLNHYEVAIEHFIEVLKSIVMKELPELLPQKGGKAAIVALGWSTLVIKHSDSESAIFKSEVPQLIIYQSLLHQFTLKSDERDIVDAAEKLMFNLWQDTEAFLSSFNTLMRSEPCSNVITFIMLHVKFGQMASHNNLLETNKLAIIDHFVKGIISAKIKPHDCYVIACRSLLNTVTVNEFEDFIYPALQKAMLRNPEIVLKSLGLIIQEINIDFSCYALSIGKVLLQNLYSKDDVARNESLESLKQLSLKCSKEDEIQQLLNNIFDILNGADGKVTVAEYRINLIQGAGNLAYNSIPSDQMEGVLLLAMDQFSKVLQTEIQERVLCHTLEMFGLWAMKFVGELPQQIIDIFRKGLELKSTTQSVRVAYLQWLLAALSNTYLKKDFDFTPQLLSVLEKASHNSGQMQVVCEAVCAACILLQVEGVVADTQLSGSWNIVFDMNKQIFFADRFLSVAPPETLRYVGLLAGKLLTDYRHKLMGQLEVIFKSIAFCLTSNSKKVRLYTLALLPKIQNCADGVAHIGQILIELKKLIHRESTIPSNVLVEIIQGLCNFEKLREEESNNLALNSLLICHHPVILYSEPNLWENIMTEKFGFDVQKFIAANTIHIEDVLINGFTENPMYEKALATISRLSPEIMLPILIKKVICDLSDPEMSSVTDEEFFIYLTPEGELFDKSVVPQEDEIYNTVRVKRENKLYNFKDQMEDLQLRREIEEKRRKEGKESTIRLTPKQEEAINKQLEKEKLIRNRLKQLNEKLTKAITIFNAASVGNSKAISLHFHKILSCFLRLFQSPLAAGPLSKVYFGLRLKCFNENSDLGYELAVMTIRLEKPHCELQKDWLLKELHESTVNTLKKLHQYTSAQILNAPSFAYAFEFLKRAVSTTSISSNEELLSMSILLIESHAQTKGNSILGNICDDQHPKYLPRKAMFQLLLNLITNHRGSIQTQAIAALLQVAEISSGNDFCALASKDEIEVFLLALESESEAVRDVASRALKIMIKPLLQQTDNDNDLKINATRRIWFAKYDTAIENHILASDLWEQCKFSPPPLDDVLSGIEHHELCIQKCAAGSLTPILSESSELIKTTLQKLLLVYKNKLVMIPPELDEFEREVTPSKDQWKPRRGVAIAILNIARLFSVEQVNQIMQFIIDEALGDQNEIVHKQMLAAALTIIDLHGKETTATLLPLFEQFLDKAPKSESYDNRRQAVVILMGSLARHLEANDSRIEPIAWKLINALHTPSQQVQEAVANCLPHLMPSLRDKAPEMIKRLLQLLGKSDKYGERRGAAYGIAGIVKGLGLLALTELDILSKLITYIQDKKNYKSREGALFAIEVLSTTLGKLLEPYIVHMLPYLLQCFGDSSQYVRQAADDTAKVIMTKLSAHGIKLVLPSLLKALDADSWRTKVAAVDLLGAMAFCAPKQLSSCLPNIVPKLIEVLMDSHTKVQEAGVGALKVIGSVIKNPEIQAMVPVILKALEDPSQNTSLCMQNLLKTKFVHYIDAPSLALIMPVVQRALIDRSTETRKMAAQLIGNMHSLSDSNDLTPYLPHIVPGLKISLLDPVPEVRAASARALGAMVRGLGESVFKDLLPWLMATLIAETNSVDRSGAAQGISEVYAGLGESKLHQIMPDIIAKAERNDIAPYIKDGYLMLFIYLPGVFNQEFTPYIVQIINPILKALADENEYVRDTALKAAQRIVNLYAETAVMLLLPELDKGLFDENWRIRFSSVKLIGDLLYRLSGVSGKMSTETANEDDNFGTEQSYHTLIRVLGEDGRNRVLSGLYMGRSDTSLVVRQAALHVWKVIVANTPRTLKELLPTLFELLLGFLANKSFDKRQVAKRTLGELVRKLGQNILPKIITILENGLNSEMSDQRQGVCIALSEVMAATSTEMVLTYVDRLVATVRKALADLLPEVREAAARTFETLHSTVGTCALNDILPAMLKGLSDSDSTVAENCLDGLRQVMLINSKVVLPYLIPQLTTAPINTRALSIVVSVAGEALARYLPKILIALLQGLSDAQGMPNEQQELDHCREVILSITNEAGIQTFVDTILISAKSDDLKTRRSASSFLSIFCTHSPGDYTQYVSQFLRCLLCLMAEMDEDILQNCWNALGSVVKSLDSTQQIAYLPEVRQAVRSAASNLKEVELPGFCLPKGIAPLLPIFREALLSGMPNEKENAAQGLGEIISLTSPQSLQPSVILITGPLIRVLGDRYNAGVKVAILETLSILLRKVGVMLKQFVPQLQTTFLKALHDTNRTVRLKASEALSVLVIIHSRVDAIFTEIHSSIKTVQESDVRETMLQAMRSVITSSAGKVTDLLKKELYTTFAKLLEHPEDITRKAAAGCIGALLKYLSEEQVHEILHENIFLQANIEGWIKHGGSVVIFVALKESGNVIMNSRYEEKLVKYVTLIISSDKVPIACNGVRAIAYLMEYCLSNNISCPDAVIFAFTRAMNHESNDVKQLVAKSCSHLGRTLPAEKFPTEILKYLVPMLVNGTKEKNSCVRSNSEKALISILRLRDDDRIYQNIGQALETGAKDALDEVVNKVLRKVSKQSTIKVDLDDTILT